MEWHHFLKMSIRTGNVMAKSHPPPKMDLSQRKKADPKIRMMYKGVER